MRHAFIITAYNEIWLLKKIVNFLSHPDCDIYINLDYGKSLSNEDKDFFVNHKHVRYCSYDKLHWGGYSIVKKEIELIEKVVSDSRVDYVHLISGQDYPIKPLRYIFDFFEKAGGNSFMDCRLATFREITRRLLTFVPYDYYNARSEKGHRITTFLRRFQERFHFRRSIRNFPELIYTGSQWCSLSIDACKYLLDFTHENKFFKNLNHTFAAEEFYIPTALGNCYDRKKVVMNNNLRFIRWNAENGNNPSNLGMEHFKMLAASKSLFARKMTGGVSKELVDLIDKLLLENYDENYSFFNFEMSIAKGIIWTLNLLNIHSILHVGDNLLYTSALLENNFKAINVYITSGAEEIANKLDITEAASVADYCCLDLMKSKVSFDILLLVNQIERISLNEISILSQCIDKMLIVETHLDEKKKDKILDIISEGNFHMEKILNKVLASVFDLKEFNVYLLIR